MEEITSNLGEAVNDTEAGIEALARELKKVVEQEVAHYWAEVSRFVEQQKEYAKYVPVVVKGKYTVRILWGKNTLLERPTKGRKARQEIRKLPGGERNYPMRDFADAKVWEKALIKQTEDRFRDLRKISELLKTMKDQKLALQNRLMQVQSRPLPPELDSKI